MLVELWVRGLPERPSREGTIERARDWLCRWRCSTWVWDGRDRPTLNCASARSSEGNMMYSAPSDSGAPHTQVEQRLAVSAERAQTASAVQHLAVGCGPVRRLFAGLFIALFVALAYLHSECIRPR